MNANQFAYVGEVSRRMGWENAVQAVHQAGIDMATAARPIWQHPRHVEIEQRRVFDHRPCSLRSCGGSCSRCIAADAWARRGGRPFLGVAQEAALARGDVA